MIYPDFKKFSELYEKYERITLYKEMFADTVTPVSLLTKFSRAEFLFLLESVEIDKTFSRFSFLGKTPEKIIYSYKDKVKVIENNNCITHYINIFEYFSQNYKDKKEHYFDSENFGDFGGGYVGFFGYETVNFMNVLKNSIKMDNEINAGFMLVNNFYVFDNFKSKLYAAVCIETNGEIYENYRNAETILDKMEKEIYEYFEHDNFVSDKNFKIEEEYRKKEFINKVKKVKREIINGEAIQVVISQKFTLEGKVNPFSFYRALRNINPSPYMFFLKFKDVVITGSSPETHLKIKKGKATLKPIAGTYSIGENIEQIKKKLLSDEKEMAEHLMLLDLARNDLYTGCEVDSVKVEKSFTTEVYSHVVHIVSEVSGILKPGVSSLKLFASTFPAGTVSGAPKVRAMELIDMYEESTRGFYSGCVGYFGYNQDIDTCITIRSAYIDSKRCIFRAGAGVVYDSIPEKEYEEVKKKLQAMFKAVELIKEIEEKDVSISR